MKNINSYNHLFIAVKNHELQQKEISVSKFDIMIPVIVRYLLESIAATL